MPSPFPGMDPYLETPDLWPDVHHELISQIRKHLNVSLGSNYVARVELRVYATDVDDPGLEVIIPDVRIEKSPRNGGKKSAKSGGSIAIADWIEIPHLIDEEIKEARLEIRHRASGSLVTIIEVVSPTNKIRGSYGRESFMKKKRETLISDVNWVEIDLLRAGVPSVALPPVRNCDYRVLRYTSQARGRYWPIGLRDSLPVVGIPLRRKDSDAPLDLNAVLRAAYEDASYEKSIDYREEPDPPLKGADKTWADNLLRERGLRK